MAKLGISTGTTPNDGTGDTLLAGAVKINSNFDEIYNTFGDGTNLSSTGIGGTWAVTSVGIHTLKNVGLGTTNPTSALTVKGNTSLETLNVSGVSTFAGDIKTNESNIVLGLSGGATEDRITWNTDSAEVYADTTRLYLKSQLSNGINIFGNGTIALANYSGSETYLLATENGPVSLYYDNSKKFETLGTGVTVTGTTFTNQLSVSGVSTIGGTLNGVYFTNIGGGNIAIGEGSLLNHNSGQNSIGIGYRALYNASNPNFSNIAIGYQAGYNVTNGVLNSFFGYNSGRLITGGSGNVILGSFDGNSFGLDIRNADNYIVLSANGQTGSNDTAPKLVIDPNGNTGIGTTNPTSKLTVRDGDISVGVSTAHGVVLTSPNGTQYRLIVDDSGALSTVAV